MDVKFLGKYNITQCILNGEIKNMSVAEICNREVVTVEKHTSIIEAAKVMRNTHAGSLVIVDSDAPKSKPLGIVTDRDLVIEVIAKDEEPGSLTVGDLMEPELLLARENDGIWETILRMRAVGVRRLPVVDKNGFLMGILSMDDLLEFLAGELSDLAKLIKRGARREKETRPIE